MFFLLFFIIVVTVFFTLKTSTLELEVKNLKIIANNIKTSIIPDYKIIIRIYILKKIKIFDKNIKEGRLQNKKRLKYLQKKLNIQNNKKGSSRIFNIKNIRNSRIKIKKFDLRITIDTENAALTAMLTGLAYLIIPNSLNYFFKLQENIKYKVEALYKNTNQLIIYFDGIFEINLIHIINTYKVLVGKYKEDNKNGTSNWKSYAYYNG